MAERIKQKLLSVLSGSEAEAEEIVVVERSETDDRRTILIELSAAFLEK